jgi:hypothetical protein
MATSVSAATTTTTARRMRVSPKVGVLLLCSLAWLTVFEGSARLVSVFVGDGYGASSARLQRVHRKPSKPLCEPCLQIVQRAPRVNLTFLNVSGGHRNHPHLGGTYEDGATFGYVHDETALRRDPPPIRYEADELREGCLVRDDNHIVLTNKVFVDLNATREVEKSGSPRPKLFCAVYTTESAHHKIPAIRETWGYVNGQTGNKIDKWAKGTS